MGRRAGILLVVAFAASILAVLPVQAKATDVLTDYQQASSLTGNASAVTLNITAQTNTTVTFSWTLSRDAIPGYDIVVGYQLFMSSTGINGQYAKVWSTSDNQRKSTSVDDLTPDKEYCFYLVANGLAGNYNSNIVLTRSTQTDDAGATLAASPHEILVSTPDNFTAYKDSLTLNVTVSFLASDGVIFWQSLTSLNYSIDGNPSVSIIANPRLELMGPPVKSDNVTVSGLADGQHEIVFTAVFVANVGNVFMPTYTLTSDPTYFTVANEGNPNTDPASAENPFPWLRVAAVGVVVAAVVAVAAVVYVKKRGASGVGGVKNP